MRLGHDARLDERSCQGQIQRQRQTNVFAREYIAVYLHRPAADQVAKPSMSDPGYLDEDRGRGEHSECLALGDQAALKGCTATPYGLVLGLVQTRIHTRKAQMCEPLGYLRSTEPRRYVTQFPFSEGSHSLREVHQGKEWRRWENIKQNLTVTVDTHTIELRGAFMMRLS